MGEKNINTMVWMNIYCSLLFEGRMQVLGIEKYILISMQITLIDHS